MTLERELMQQCGIRYTSARKITAIGRKNLGMTENSPVTPELEEECLRLCKSQTAAEISLQVEDIFSVQETLKKEKPSKHNLSSFLEETERNIDGSSERQSSHSSIDSGMPSLDSYQASDCSNSSHQRSSTETSEHSVFTSWDSVKFLWSSTMNKTPSSLSVNDSSDLNSSSSNPEPKDSKLPFSCASSDDADITAKRTITKDKGSIKLLPVPPPPSPSPPLLLSLSSSSFGRHLFPGGRGFTVQCDNAAQHPVSVSDWSSRLKFGFTRAGQSVQSFLQKQPMDNEGSRDTCAPRKPVRQCSDTFTDLDPSSYNHSTQGASSSFPLSIVETEVLTDTESVDSRNVIVPAN